MSINVNFVKMSADEAEIRLRDLAQQAFGSGSKEGTNGGAGYIVINGEGLPVKVLTKLSERKWFAFDSKKDAQLIEDAIGRNNYSHKAAREYIFNLIEKFYADCNLTDEDKGVIKDVLGYKEGYSEKPLERRQVAEALNYAACYSDSYISSSHYTDKEFSEKTKGKFSSLNIWDKCSADTEEDTGSVNVVQGRFNDVTVVPTKKEKKLGLTSVHLRQARDLDRQLKFLKGLTGNLACYNQVEYSFEIEDSIKKARGALCRMASTARQSQGKAKLRMVEEMVKSMIKLNATLKELGFSDLNVTRKDLDLGDRELQVLKERKWESLDEYDAVVGMLPKELKAELRYVVPNVENMPTTDEDLQNKHCTEKDVAFKGIKLNKKISERLANSFGLKSNKTPIDLGKSLGEDCYLLNYQSTHNNDNKQGFFSWSDFRGDKWISVMDGTGSPIFSFEDLELAQKECNNDGLGTKSVTKDRETKSVTTAREKVYDDCRKQFTHGNETDEYALRKFAHLCTISMTAPITSTCETGMKDCPPWDGEVVGEQLVSVAVKLTYEKTSKKYTAHINFIGTPLVYPCKNKDGEYTRNKNDFDKEKSFITMQWDVTFDNDKSFKTTKVSTITLSGRIRTTEGPLLDFLQQ